MSETVYAHTLSVRAYERTADASTSCYARATTELGLAICGLSGRGNQSAQTPQYQAPPTFIDRVVQFAPLALGLGQLVASDRANTRQTDASVQMAAIGARRELGIVQAATGSNERIATGGFNAVSNIATQGYTALGSAANAASNASAANSQAWAFAIAALPPTSQVIAGGSITQAGRDIDQSVTGRNRLQDSGGAEVEVIRPIICTATGGPASAVLGGLTASTTGITSALNPGYNPVKTPTRRISRQSRGRYR